MPKPCPNCGRSCQCDTNEYHLSKAPESDRRVIAESLRRLSEDVAGGRVKQISWHVAYESK